MNSCGKNKFYISIQMQKCNKCTKWSICVQNGEFVYNSVIRVQKGQFVYKMYKSCTKLQFVYKMVNSCTKWSIRVRKGQISVQKVQFVYKYPGPDLHSKLQNGTISNVLVSR